LKPDASKALLVIALSSRPYVEAAKQAGFRVVAIDAFADRQTHDLTERLIVVDYNERGFNAAMMMAVIDGLNVAEYCGMIYGSGFEAQPALLQYIADRIPLIGNTAENVAAVKTPSIFFATLTRLGIPHPPLKNACLTDSPIDDIQNVYIRKLVGGSGGIHIQPIYGNPSSPNYYDQQYLAGKPVSLLFLAHKGLVKVVGFNEQWLNPAASLPFRYGGAVSNIKLAKNVEMQLVQVAQKLTREFNLKGLNSLDAILKNDVAYVLEINPRLSATFDLYPDKAVNILRHIQACQPEMIQPGLLCGSPSALTAMNICHAHAIVYASSDVAISTDFDWPEWATDTPLGMTYIEAQQPVCTVLSTAENSEAAKQLAQSRVKILLKSLSKNNLAENNKVSLN
jgi:predicted ATP-grasp superfamily ATP-dependent carboligase